VTVAARFAGALAALCPDGARLGLAVSGGGDSMALLHLAAGVVPPDRLAVATVDHHLRPGSGDEAAAVAQAAAELGLAHDVLDWRGWDGQGNLQAAARTARRELLADWARRNGLDAVVLGHTQDDQAETVLMRLARGSGVDGLAAMAAHSRAQGMVWLRPLLGHARAELRDWLRAHGVRWTEDPSNDDPGYDRIRARQMLADLAGLGLTPERLAQTAAQMQAARAVLDAAADDAAQALMRAEHGDIVFDAGELDALPLETRDRLVARALCMIASTPYRPRLRALHAALNAPVATLHGCLLTRARGELRITREAQAVADLRAPLGSLWDQRWSITAPAARAACGLEIRALGASGLAQCPDRTGWLLPRRSLLASPAVWDGPRLIAAPLAGIGEQWKAVTRESPHSTGPAGVFALNVGP